MEDIVIKASVPVSEILLANIMFCRWLNSFVVTSLIAGSNNPSVCLRSYLFEVDLQGIGLKRVNFKKKCGY